MMLSFQNKTIASVAGLITVTFLCSIGIISLQKLRVQSEKTENLKAKYLKQEKTQEINLSIFKSAPTFGFRNLAADWIYLDFLQYFGDGEARQETGYSLSPDYFEAVVKLDPRFVRAHLRLSPATSIFAGQPKKDIALIEQSLQSVSPQTAPEAYYLWIYKGVDELLMLGDTKAAKETYEMAAKWAEASNDPSIQERAAGAKQTAQFIAKNPDSKVSRIGAWTMVLSSATDEKTQQRAIQEIEALDGKIITTPEGRISVKVPEE